MSIAKNQRKQRLLTVVLAILLTLVATVEAIAESPGLYPRVIVYPEASLKQSRIRLADIATISSQHAEFAELVNALRNVDLGEAPPPRMSITMPGLRVLNTIEQAGIPLDSFRYSIPQAVQITRQGQVLKSSDVLSAVRNVLNDDPALDVKVREVNWDHAQVIPDGVLSYDIRRLGSPHGGKVPLRIGVAVNGEPAARFLATAIVDDWREVPVLNKNLARGMLIQPDDVEMIRLNLFKQPPDVMQKADTVIGKRLTGNISAGTTIRSSMVDIPPVIAKGTRINISYQSGALLATATGMAMQNGQENEIIEVKNIRSRRIVRARVINPELVEVSAE